MVCLILHTHVRGYGMCLCPNPAKSSRTSSLLKLCCPFLTLHASGRPCWKGAPSWHLLGLAQAQGRRSHRATRPGRGSAKASRAAGLRAPGRIAEPFSFSSSSHKGAAQAGAALPSQSFPEGKWLRHNGQHGRLRAAVSYKLSAMTISTQRNNLIPHSRHHGLIYSFKVITQG